MKPSIYIRSFSISLIILCSCLSFSWQVTPHKIVWNDLKDVKFKKRFNKQVSMYVLYPEFGDKVKALESKEVEIRGYMIPVDPAENVFVLSAYPMAACFFCGGSGPESIIQLKMKKPRRFATDEVWTVKGTLKLNADNIEELNYILQDTEPVRKH
ncbi:DUF3299 domain-containing protein [Emticicia soli]|uniref:DUF3299 domain-containing protein n=1 Tax=Emticicia soli TaxID=2027878 RepID=A0ABW5JGK2_9BACT